MSLHSISVMVITPLAIAVAGVLLLTPKDILRQPVMPATDRTAAALDIGPAGPVETASLSLAELAEPAIEPASLVVVSSPRSTLAALGSEEDDAAATDRRWITASGLNLRATPGVNGKFIATLPYGTPVVVIETSGSWAHVESGAFAGWLSAKFLTTEEPQGAVD